MDHMKCMEFFLFSGKNKHQLKHLDGSTSSRARKTVLNLAGKWKKREERDFLLLKSIKFLFFYCLILFRHTVSICKWSICKVYSMGKEFYEQLMWGLKRGNILNGAWRGGKCLHSRTRTSGLLQQKLL